MKLKRLITAIDAHAAGMSLRLVTGGLPRLQGSSVMERMQYMRGHHDDIRALSVQEPRGHSGVYGAVLTETSVPGADAGVFFFSPAGYDSICGHGTIAVCTILVQMGMVKIEEPETQVVLETPVGLVRASVAVQAGNPLSVTVQNVPCFVYALDLKVDVPGFGQINADIASGGADFFALLSAESVGLQIRPDLESDFVTAGRAVYDTLSELVKPQHPEHPGIAGFTGVIFSGPPTHPMATLKDASFCPAGFIDRSPCGAGTCAKMATLYARKELGLNAEFVHESIIGTLFKGKLLAETTVGSFPAVLPTITGEAYITGFNQLVLDDRDPFPRGFTTGCGIGVQ